jgi:hypothetical protein
MTPVTGLFGVTVTRIGWPPGYQMRSQDGRVACRAYFSRTERRRTSPVVLTASCTTWNRCTTSRAAGSIRRTAEAQMEHMSMATTSTWSRQAAGACASQYAASPSRLAAWPGSPPVPGQVKETRVPAVREQHVLAGLLISPPAGPPAAVLADAQVRYRAGANATWPGS